MTLSSRAIEAGARALSDLTGGGDAKFNHMREVYLRESKACLTAALAAKGMVLVPKSALDWLNGEAPDADGLWFVDGDASHNDHFWWRSEFRAMLSAHQADEDSEGKKNETR
jgi:hypothetical protein